MLDVSVLKLSEVRQDNAKFRFDDGYFSKLSVFTHRRMENLPHVRLGDTASVFRKGIFDIKASSYTDSGIPFVRISDLGEGLINPDKVTFIPESVHRAEWKTALAYGDLVMSKTAYPAAAFVNLAECNVSQDTIAVRLKPKWRERLKSGFVVAFLRCRYGLALMGRQFQGNVQAHLSLPDGKKLPIPLFSENFHERVHGLFVSADARRKVALESMETAERVLSEGLGLSVWKPPDQLAYTHRFSDVFAAGRLDAAYFSPRVKQLTEILGADEICIRNVAPARHEEFTPVGAGEFDYIEISDVRSDGTVGSSRLQYAEAPSRATWYVHAGDVVTSTVRPNRRLSATIAPEQDGFVCSSGFVVLEPREVSPELLLTYLRLPPICELMDLHTSASMYPAISERDLLTLPFRRVSETTEREIVATVRRAHAARREARDLLENSKRAVEIAIEKSEDAALRYLEQSNA